jgi:chorismate synthase
MLRILTAGESHGPALVSLIEGLPAGLHLDIDAINRELARRQKGYGRGDRQQIERDRVHILGGAVHGQTIGAPLAMMVPNRDYENWRDLDVPAWTRPRPGHADLEGAIKYGLDDMRLVAERASARTTAALVAVGERRQAPVGGRGHCRGQLCRVHRQRDHERGRHARWWARYQAGSGRALPFGADSDVSCPDPEASARMRAAIDAAKEAGESLGGIIVVGAWGLMPGLGSHVHWDRRLDARLAQAVIGIQAIKGVEIGPAFANTRLPGTQVHDALYAGLTRRTNRAGGVEGGMTNGEILWLRAAMKPIPTTVTPIPTVDLATGEETGTEYQRSDVCAVPAAAIVTEAMVSWVLADALLERYGADNMAALVRRVQDDRAT